MEIYVLATRLSDRGVHEACGILYMGLVSIAVKRKSNILATKPDLLCLCETFLYTYI